MSDATLMEIKDFFNYSSSEMAAEWRRLDDVEREFFKREVGLALDSQRNSDDKS